MLLTFALYVQTQSGENIHRRKGRETKILHDLTSGKERRRKGGLSLDS